VLRVNIWSHHTVLDFQKQASLFLEKHFDNNLGLGKNRTMKWVFILLCVLQVSGGEVTTPFARMMQRQQGREAASLVATNDWEAIRQRGALRMITQNNPFCCYIHHGRVLGFEYELVKKFAAEHHLVVAIEVAPNGNDVEEWLRQGKGDLIAANFALTPQRARALPDLRFTYSYGGATQVAVGRLDETARNITELRGRKIYAREGSFCYDTLLELIDQDAPFELFPALGARSDLEMLESVAAGNYDVAVCDDTMVLLAMEGGCAIKPLFPVSRKQSWCWVVRRQNPKLAEVIMAFWEKEHKSSFYNQLVSRYFTSASFAQTIVPTFLDKDRHRISEYDDLFRKYGLRYGFDWRLLAAQAYQESKFDLHARSHCGAQGLMQLMPETARELGFADVITPEQGIHAGVKYLSKLYRSIDGDVHQNDKLCFALASYNAGAGHVSDARQITRMKGLDPNRWYGHVEEGLRMLSRPEYATQAPFGYCRAAETLRYVDQILLHYRHYKTVLEAQTPFPPPPH
jgi:membrane-bound lytic murein transglycosylase F